MIEYIFEKVYLISKNLKHKRIKSKQEMIKLSLSETNKYFPLTLVLIVVDIQIERFAIFIIM